MGKTEAFHDHVTEEYEKLHVFYLSIEFSSEAAVYQDLIEFEIYLKNTSREL